MSDQTPAAGPSAAATIVVSGLGAVSGCGWGLDATWALLCSGRSAIGPVTRFDHQRQRTHLAAEVPPAPAGLSAAVLRQLAVFRGESEVAQPSTAGQEARLSSADRFALAATAEALTLAGLETLPPGKIVGVFFGTSTAGMFEAETTYAKLLAGSVTSPTAEPEASRRRYRPRLAQLASQPMNAPGDCVARAVGATGPVLTISSACTSGALAIAAALDALRSGEVDLAIAGGADELCQLTYAGFNALRAVDPRPARPFRADRAGLTLGEGAGVLVLERADDAAARGASALAVLAGAGSSCDAEHMTAPAQGGTGAARAICEALADAGIGGPDAPPAAGEIAFVNAHGTGTPLNDAAEWAAFAATLGPTANTIPVTSTKGVVGHLLGAAGAFEAVVTVLCLRNQQVHPTPGDGELDPALAVHLVRDLPLTIPGAHTALSTSLAFGGSNAALIFKSSAPLPQLAGATSEDLR